MHVYRFKLGVVGSISPKEPGERLRRSAEAKKGNYLIAYSLKPSWLLVDWSYIHVFDSFLVDFSAWF